MTSLGRDCLGVWSTMTTRRVQTNDTSRAVAWLWPAFLSGCEDAARPLALVDVGAGAGLNLIGDQLPAIWTDATTHEAIPCAMRINAVARVGFDTRPLNVNSDDDVLWMRACIWPGDTDRLARFEAGVRALRASAKRPSRPNLERLTASLVPERVSAILAHLPPNTLLLAYQTLVAGYMEAVEQENYRRGMLALLSRQSTGSALWIELELEDARRRLPAVLTAHILSRTGLKALRIARSSQHPTELEVDALAVFELCRHLVSGR
jgi:hypothetical protein